MEKPILFNTAMVRAILEGKKTQTRRPLKRGENHWYPIDYEYVKTEKIYRSPEGAWTIPKNHNGMYHALFKPNNWHSITTALFPPYQIGDVLWVREAWSDYDGKTQYYYRADYPDGTITYEWPELDEFGEKIICDLPKWKPSIHMPRTAARIFLKVTNVKVEKLKDITVKGVESEGLRPINNPFIYNFEGTALSICHEEFAKLWNSTVNKKDIDVYGWDANPWVWVIQFETSKRLEK